MGEEKQIKKMLFAPLECRANMYSKLPSEITTSQNKVAVCCYVYNGVCHPEERKRDFPVTNLPEINFRGPFPLIQRCELFLTDNTSSEPIKLNRKF